MLDRHPDFWVGLVLGALLGGLVAASESASVTVAFVTIVVGCSFGLAGLWAYDRWFTDSK